MVYSVGIIGTSFGASYHTPAFQNHPRFEVKCIAGRKFDKTQKIAGKLGVEPIDDWKSMILDPTLDIISIATPPHLHFEMAKKALNNGKHIFLEKPTTLNTEQAYEIMKMAKKNSLAGMMSHEWRFYHVNQVLYNLVQKEKKIGSVDMIRAQDLLTYAYNQWYSWQYDSEQGGGWLGIAGSHIVDIIRFLTGSEIIEVMGSTGIRTQVRQDAKGQDHTVTAEDYFSVIFQMKNSIHGIIDHLPSLNPAPASRLIVSGSEGTIHTRGSNILIPEEIYFSSYGNQFTSVEVDPNPHAIDEKGIGGVMHDLFQLLLDQLYESIQYQEVIGPSLFDGWRNQSVINAIKASQQQGKRIRINL